MKEKVGAKENSVTSKATLSQGSGDSLTHRRSSTRARREKPQRPRIAATYRYDSELLENMKDIAHWERKTIQEVFDEAMTSYIKKYKRKNGEIQPR